MNRQPHAVLDLASRASKAQKIERILGLHEIQRPLRILEVGTGSGGIAHYFATGAGLAHDVDAVDVVDQRLVRDGYRFTQVSSVDLPFPDAAFDVVLSNHVIEHVGDEHAQAQHLSELKRVLKPAGIGYLAVPNRWMLVEPHYRLAFLSWWPEFMRTPYLRLSGRGSVYDCRPLAAGHIEAILGRSGFHFEQWHGAALRMTYEIEQPDAWLYRRLLSKVPDRIWHALRKIFPTLIYVVRPEPVTG